MVLFGTKEKNYDTEITLLNERQNELSEKSTLDEIAKELNMSKRNLQRTLQIKRNDCYKSTYRCFKSCFQAQYGIL